MAKGIDGRLSFLLALWMISWFLYRHKRLTVNGFVRCFVKEGDSNLLQPDEQKQEAVQQTNSRSVLLMHIYCLTFLTKCGSRQSGHHYYSDQTQDNVRGIVVRFLAEARYLSLL
jgi:hypothetical protein